MPVVLKNNNNKKGPAGAWISYGIVGFCGLALVATAFLGGEKAPDPMDPSYKYSEYKDLADMPFSDEEAEAELLSSVRYGDIAKNDFINALFSEEDKEARKAEDAANGVPEPPDEEYAEAAKKKAVKKTAKEKYQQSRARAKAKISNSGRTSKGALSSSGGVRTGHASSGVQSTIWRADDKKKDSASGQSAASGRLANQAAQQLKQGGRNGSFMAAYEKSKAAAAADNLEDAHSLAVDAFQQGGDLEADLQGELEKGLEGVDFNKMMGELDKEKASRAASSLDEKLDKAKKDADKKDKNKKDFKCDGPMMNGQVDTGCMMGELLKAAMDIGKNVLQSALSSKGKGDDAATAAENAARLSEIENDMSGLDKNSQDYKNLLMEQAYLQNGGTLDGWGKFKADRERAAKKEEDRRKKEEAKKQKKK